MKAPWSQKRLQLFELLVTVAHSIVLGHESLLNGGRVPIWPERCRLVRLPASRGRAEVTHRPTWMPFTMLRTSSLVSSPTARYRSVVSRLEWPNHICILRALAPRLWRSLAKFLRKRCRIHFPQTGASAHETSLPSTVSHALAAVETAVEGYMLEPAQKVTVRPSVIPENQ